MLLAASLGALALAAPPDPTWGHLSGPLRAAARAADKGAAARWAERAPEHATADDVRVVLEVADARAAREGLSALGLAPSRSAPVDAGAWLQVRVPWSQLADLRAVPGLRRARLAHVADAKERGDVVSESLEDVFRDGDWLDAGIDGRRVRIAVVDVGFDGADDLHGTELGPWLRTDPDGEAGSGHGTAVAELVHDMAPRSRLQLRQFRTDVEFLALLEDIEDEQVDIVNGSIGFDNVWPADGTSPFTRAVDRLESTGALWVGAAGNEGGRYLAGPIAHAGGGALTIAGELGAWVPAGGSRTEARLRWSEPMRAAAIDIDLVATEEDGTICAIADDPQDGDDDPLEELLADCAGPWVWLSFATAPEAAVDGLVAWLYAPDGLDPATVADGLGTLTLPGDTRRGLAVGACSRVRGTAPSYSSIGPTEDGRTKPDLCVGDGVSTATYGIAGFFGTSATAPHVTGFAALVMHGEDLRGEPSGTRDRVLSSTVDLGDPGLDDLFGEGALDAGPPPEGCHCAATRPGAAAPALLLLALVVPRRRRRTPPSHPACIPRARAIAPDAARRRRPPVAVLRRHPR